MSSIESLKEGVLAELLSQTIDLHQAVTDLPKELDKSIGNTLEKLQDTLERAENLSVTLDLKREADYSELQSKISTDIKEQLSNIKIKKNRGLLIFSVFSFFISICLLTAVAYMTMSYNSDLKKAVRTLAIQDRALNALPQSAKKQFLDEYAKQLEAQKNN
ncbi:hypothetical protein V8N79_004354 [Salmonella enterica]